MSDPAAPPAETADTPPAESLPPQDHHGHDIAAPPLQTIFPPEEIKAFDNDDREAGANICKMLSLFFFYTVIVMGLSTYVTWKWVLQ